MLFQVVRPRCDVLSKAARRALKRLLLLQQRENERDVLNI